MTPLILRLEEAIQAFDSGDESKKLLDEFLDLINQGLSEANYFVGCIYEDGSNEVQKNLEFAFFYYKQSVDEIGYLEGILALARFYYNGFGVSQSYEKAYEFYKIVADKKIHPVACFMLGRMYQNGTGVSKDLYLARSYYKLAVDRGSIYGMVNLAMLEAEEGNKLKSVWLRIRAGFKTFFIAVKNPRDVRLRGG